MYLEATVYKKSMPVCPGAEERTQRQPLSCLKFWFYDYCPEVRQSWKPATASMTNFRHALWAFALLWSTAFFQYVNTESILCPAAQSSASKSMNAPPKPRVFILSDILNEPDDSMSLVRLLVYSNLLDIRGLCATTSVFLQDSTHPEEMRNVIEAYGSVVGNLNRHVSADFQFSAAEKILPLVTSGPTVSGILDGAYPHWNRHRLTPSMD